MSFEIERVCLVFRIRGEIKVIRKRYCRILEYRGRRDFISFKGEKNVI